MSSNNCSRFVDYSLSWHENFTGAFRLYVSPTIALIGIVGNIFVIIIFLLENKKSRFSIYCKALSGSHIIILLVNTFMDDFMGGGLKHRDPNFFIKFDTYSPFMCRFMEFLPNVMYTTSSGLLLVFSVDRVMTIFRPMQFYSIHYRRFAFNLCLIVLLVAGLINIPLLISSELIATEPRKCQINDKILTGRTSIFVKVFVTFVIPTFVILVLNVVICLKLWRVKIQRTKILSKDFQKNNLEMNRICGHLALNSVFLLFTFPLVITMVLRQSNECMEIYKDLSKMFSSTKDVSYALDFLLYFVFLANFRWRFIRYFVAPVLRCRLLKNTRLSVFVEGRLVKFDSSSSRRKYKTITAALSTCNNKQMFGALMFKENRKSTLLKDPPRQQTKYSIAHHSENQTVTPGQIPEGTSFLMPKAVSYASDIKEEKQTLLLLKQ